MGKNILSLVAFFIFSSSSFSGSVASEWIQVEKGERHLKFWVESFGCTTKDDFRLTLSERLPHEISLVRIKPETCEMAYKIEELVYTADELGLNSFRDVVLSNSHSTETEMGKTPVGWGYQEMKVRTNSQLSNSISRKLNDRLDRFSPIIEEGLEKLL